MFLITNLSGMVRKMFRTLARLIIVLVLVLSVYTKVFFFSQEISVFTRVYKNLHYVSIVLDFRIPAVEEVLL